MSSHRFQEHRVDGNSNFPRFRIRIRPLAGWPAAGELSMAVGMPADSRKNEVVAREVSIEIHLRPRTLSCRLRFTGIPSWCPAVLVYNLDLDQSGPRPKNPKIRFSSLKYVFDISKSYSEHVSSVETCRICVFENQNTI